MNKAHILLVEDEPKIAAAITEGLSEHGYSVMGAADGLKGRDLFDTHHIDLAILDLNLPGMAGLDLCRHIRAADSRLPVLMLTAWGATEQKLAGFEAGADDYLVKPFAFQELLARIKALLKRALHTGAAAEKTLRLADLEMNLDRKEVKRAGQSVQLTAKEYQLLEFFMRHQNRVLSRADIARGVWDIDFDTHTNVIDVYVNFLRRKIDKGFRPRLIHTQIGMGYILKEEAD